MCYRFAGLVMKLCKPYTSGFEGSARTILVTVAAQHNCTARARRLIVMSLLELSCPLCSLTEPLSNLIRNHSPLNRTALRVRQTQVFYRERSASLYNPFAYGVAISLVELPYLLALTAVYMPITYFTVDFKHSAEAFWCVRPWAIIECFFACVRVNCARLLMAPRQCIVTGSLCKLMSRVRVHPVYTHPLPHTHTRARAHAGTLRSCSWPTSPFTTRLGRR
jgi:hypothetical protein